MKDKYIKFFKKELVFLLILLLVVSFSFGVSYSNFIYNSDMHRAVEMYNSSLKYEIEFNNAKVNNITVKPGNNLINLNIKSINEVDSYYKLVFKNDSLNVKYFNKSDNNILRKNEQINLSLLIFNNKAENQTIELKVIGGYINNTYEQIIVENGYKTIDDNITIGKSIIYDSKPYRLLSIDENGTYELISDVVSRVNISGSLGYNNYIQTINSGFAINSRVLNIEDINKYLNINPINYTESRIFLNSYYPVLWKYEQGSIINGLDTKGFVSRSGKFLIDESYSISNSIESKKININNLEFKDNIYEEIFSSSNYLLATRFNTYQNNRVYWGVLSMNDGGIRQNILYDSNNNNYDVNDNIRILLKVSNNINLFNENN